MNTKKLIKRLASVFTVLILLLSAFPLTAFAAEVVLDESYDAVLTDENGNPVCCAAFLNAVYVERTDEIIETLEQNRIMSSSEHKFNYAFVDDENFWEQLSNIDFLDFKTYEFYDYGKYGTNSYYIVDSAGERTVVFSYGDEFSYEAPNLKAFGLEVTDVWEIPEFTWYEELAKYAIFTSDKMNAVFEDNTLAYHFYSFAFNSDGASVAVYDIFICTPIQKEVTVNYVDTNGNLIDKETVDTCVRYSLPYNISDVYYGSAGYVPTEDIELYAEYETEAKEISGYELTQAPDNASYSSLDSADDEIVVTYIYTKVAEDETTTAGNEETTKSEVTEPVTDAEPTTAENTTQTAESETTTAQSETTAAAKEAESTTADGTVPETSTYSSGIGEAYSMVEDEDTTGDKTETTAEESTAADDTDSDNATDETTAAQSDDGAGDESETLKSSDIPDTADNFHAAVWVALAILSLAAILFLLFYGRKKESDTSVVK